MSALRQAAEAVLKEYDECAPLAVGMRELRAALAEPVFDCPRCGHCCPQPRLDFTKVRTITADGRCLGWDGNEINTAA